jgi:hypothetical protein
MRTIVGIGTGLVLAVGLLGAGVGDERRESLDGFERYVDEKGDIRFSRELSRQGLDHLGSWFVPAGDASGFHHVFTQPEAMTHFRETGRFPDGTVLVKEITTHERGDFTTGKNVAFATGEKQWFVMVKDEHGRFPDHPLWGNGWGWALFKSADPSRNVATDFRKDCLGCHAPAHATDWVYSDGYPLLRQQ